MLERKPQRQKLFVVAELDVVARPALFDQTVFEDRGFFFGCRDVGLEVGDAFAKQRNESARVAPAILEVASNARAQTLGFADVKRTAALVAKDVTARPRRQRRELFFDGFGKQTPVLAL